MLWKSQEPHLWKRQSYPLEDAECCSLHIPMDQRDLRCTRVHSQQEHCSPRSQARQHSGKLTNANKPQTSQKSIALRVNLIFSTIDYWLCDFHARGFWFSGLIFGPFRHPPSLIWHMGDFRRGIEWSLRAFASMRAVRLFLRAWAVINFLMRAASTLEITNGEQRALRKFPATWNLSLFKRCFAPSNLANIFKTGQQAQS